MILQHIKFLSVLCYILYCISNREMDDDGVSPTGSEDTGGNKDTRDD